MIGGALGRIFVVFAKVAANALCGLTGIPMIGLQLPFGVQNVMNYVIGMLIATWSHLLSPIIFKVKRSRKIIKEWSQS
ncbi:hypothetical protein ACEQPO_28235 [Bacillus sp. SL00103]